MNNTAFANEIKSRLTMSEILAFYGFSPNSKGFICCPFHNEKTPSFKAYNGTGGCNCFGCGEHGSVIDFVMKYFNLSFTEAVKKLNADFGLGLPIGDVSFEQLREMYYKSKMIQAKREREKAEKEKIKAEYWAAFDEWKRLDDNRRKYKPTNQDEELHPLFIESLQKLEHALYVLEMLEVRRRTQ